ncbi:carboxypeptidase regulatory-like domain-containing protein [bacterium]|nr:carboxypeptidase regulatory-like domain-containing protein [bacterium]
MNSLHRPNGHPTTLRPALFALFAVALLTTSCEQSTRSPFLVPTGNEEEGGSASFSSDYDAVQALGAFNGWNESQPSMELVADGVWEDSQIISAGSYKMKFRTDLTWDTPADWGCCDGETCDEAVPVPEDGTEAGQLLCERAGPGGDIGPIEFPTTGLYRFQFDEITGAFTIRSIGSPVAVGGITGMVAFGGASPLRLPVATVTVLDTGTTNARGTAMSDAADGTWTVGDLPSGNYDVRFVATGYVDSTVADIHVNAPDTTSMAAVALEPLPIGSLAGTISFSDNPSPRPTATVRVFTVGTTTQVGAGATGAGGAYSIAGLLEGMYDVTVTAPNYQTQNFDSVAVVRQVVTTRNATLAPFTYQIVGDFNSWNTNAPTMGVVSAGTFSTVTTVTAGCYRVKVRTNNDWDETPDYGRCSGDVGPCQITVNPIQIVNVCEGVGLSDALGEVDFAVTGTYLFGFELNPSPRLTIQRLAP